MTKTEALEELLEYVRDDRDMLSEERDRLERKVARLRHQLAVQTQLATEYGDLSSARGGEIVALRNEIHELVEQAEVPPRTPEGAFRFELYDAKATIQQQALAIGIADKDLAAWAERCERAENLLRGYLQNVDRGELDHKAREHFLALGERQ